jgi:SAM-dependent methyltransferase
MNATTAVVGRRLPTLLGGLKRFVRRNSTPPPLLRNVAWSHDTEVASVCPLCGVAGNKRVILEMALASGGDAPDSARTSLLHCGNCSVRYCMPLLSVDYEEVDRDALKFYLEQGAGIVSMLETFSLIDDRPIANYLEIGCSFGFAMDYARRVLGWRVRGYDPGGIAAAGKRLLWLPIRNRFFRGIGPFGAKANLVLCSEVIEHISEPMRFMRLLRGALRPGGLLLLTTPNGGSLNPELPSEVMLPILSPGHHVILYDAASLEFLLHQAGFEHIRVIDNGNQLRVAASMQPFSGQSAYFTPTLYHRFLELAVKGCAKAGSRFDGLVYRLLKEEVNAGRYTAGRNCYTRLRDAIQERYRIDTDAPADFAAAPASETNFRQFGERYPYNLAGIWYCLGMIQLLGDHAPEQAAQSLAAAIRFGAALREQLRRLGTDDLETAHLCRAAEIARLSALVQFSPIEAVQEFAALRAAAGCDDRSAHTEGARVRLFGDLVNLGQHALAEHVIGDAPPPLDELVASHSLDGALAWGIYLLNTRSDFIAAANVFAQVWEAARNRQDQQDALWLARFHQALASRYAGKQETARRIAAEIVAPPKGLSPAPDAILARIGELMPVNG